MSETDRSVDELEQEPINNETMVGEFPWQEMNKRETLRVMTMLEAAIDTYRGLEHLPGGGVPYSLRQKKQQAEDRLSQLA